MSTFSYAYWQNALAGKFGPIHDGDAQPGFYRKRASKDGPWQRVAIWPVGDVLVATVEDKEADPAHIWTWVCDKPITEAQFRRAERGEGWADDLPAPVLSNLPADPHDALQVEFAAERETAEEFLKTPITTKEQADQVAVLTKRLSGIKNKATDLHKVEKQPHLDAGRSVDDKWRDLKDDPDALAKRLKGHLQPYLLELDRQERERVRLAKEEAERKRQEEAKAAAVAVFEGTDEAAAEAEAAKAAAAEATQAAEPVNARVGRTGAAVSLRTFTVAKIVDFDALLMGLKDRPEVVELVTSLANRAARSGVSLPGMEITEERRAA